MDYPVLHEYSGILCSDGIDKLNENYRDYLLNREAISATTVTGNITIEERMKIHSGLKFFKKVQIAP